MKRALAAGLGYAAAHRLAEARRAPHDAGAEASGSDAAIATLRERGFAVVPDLLTAKEMEAVRRTEAFQSMPAASSEAASDEWRLSALGRYHRIDFADADVQTFARIEKRLAPFVSKYFDVEFDVVADGVERGPVLYRSELQLLNAAPHSQNQIWHSDHRVHGLTLVVPLTDFTPLNGATQLLPGSHALPSSWSWLLGGAQIAAAPAGGLLAYDARMYHRGLGNTTEKSRPALVFRYDRRDERPPPGVGLAGSLFHTTSAVVLHTVTATVAALGELLTPNQGRGP